MYTPVSVPANSSPLRFGSLRTTRVNASAATPAVIFVQVRPKSRVRKRYGRKSSSLYRVAATYAVPASNGEASMMLMSAQAGRPFGVTLRHDRAPRPAAVARDVGEPAAGAGPEHAALHG